MSVKRQTYQASAEVDLNTQRLQCIGMRIRQSVSNGYNLPPLRADSYVPQQSVQQDYQQQSQQQCQQSFQQSFQQPQKTFQRVPLPLSQPPALDFNGSTASSLAGWEDELSGTSRVERLAQSSPSGKRSRDVYEEGADKRELSDYVQSYGPLSFNEEF